MEYHYTAREAIERLGLPRRTFYYLVSSGQINKVALPLRKQALYLKAEIDRLAAQREEVLSMRQADRRMLSLSVPSMADLEQTDKIWWLWTQHSFPRWDKYAAEFQRYNPQVMHVLKDTSTDTVLGGVMMSPLKAHALQWVLHHGISWLSDPSSCLPFEAPDNAPIDVYVFGLLVRYDLRPSLVAALLLRGAFRFLESLLDRGVVVHRLFAVADSLDSDRLLRKLGFDPLPVPDGGDPSVQRYMLNPLATNPARSKLVRAYQRSHHNLIRRVRRYEQTDKEVKVS